LLFELGFELYLKLRQQCCEQFSAADLLDTADSLPIRLAAPRYEEPVRRRGCHLNFDHKRLVHRGTIFAEHWMKGHSDQNRRNMGGDHSHLLSNYLV
jgi:hypothetical protein